MFVAIEGIDGAGTTTQTKLVADALRARGIAVHATHEPSARAVGKLIRAQLRDGGSMPEAAMALLFAADRLDHYHNEIGPALQRGDVVLSDRYVLSSLVYQGEALGGWPVQLNAHAPAPDLTVLIEVSPELAAARRTQRGGAAERYDDNTMQTRLASRYDALAPRGTLRLDGTRPPAEISAAIVSAIAEKLTRR
jgi:dTMP kinase